MAEDAAQPLRFWQAYIELEPDRYGKRRGRVVRSVLGTATSASASYMRPWLRKRGRYAAPVWEPEVRRRRARPEGDQLFQTGHTQRPHRGGVLAGCGRSLDVLRS